MWIYQLQILQVCAMMRSILSCIGPPAINRAPQAGTSQRTPRYVRSIRSTHSECTACCTRSRTHDASDVRDMQGMLGFFLTTAVGKAGLDVK